MDPFLPGEIPVMVLRYLAANQCTASAMKLIDEMPKMSDYIPAKPANVSEKGYLKHLLRSSVNRGLKDVLWDYGTSRILVEDMLDTDMDNDLSSSFTSDSLLSKIEILQKMLEKLSQSSSSSGSNCKPQPSQINNDRSKPKPSVVTVDNYSNTEDYECPKCLAKRLEIKSTSESGCQTEEYTAVQFGINDKDDITMIFCKKLLDDNNLQQKISDTINEHMLDPHNKQNKDFLQKVSSKAESEIDKFLVELLQDMPEDDGNSNSLPGDIGLLSNGSNVLAGPSSFAEIEKNLTAMFKDTEIMQGNSNSSGAANQTNDDVEPSHKLILHTPTSDPAQATCSTKALVDMLVETPSPNSSRSNDIAADITPESSTNTRTRIDSESSSVSIKTPKRSQRPHAVKRITPTPIASAKANPVFDTCIVVENKTVDMGEKSAKIAVVTKNIETPAWQKLNRRSIAPKIPCEAQTSTIPVIGDIRTRTLSRHEDKVLKIGDDINKNDDKKQSDEVIIISYAPSASTVNMNGSSSAVKKTATTTLIQEHQPSAHKRKATPVKLTPEKAKNANFEYIFHDSNKKQVSVLKPNDVETSAVSVTANADSAIKKTPLPISHNSVSKNLTASSSISSKLGLLTENSQPDVTPMQPIPEESDYPNSDLNTISPNALQRLIASASKAGNTAAVARFAHKRKSYSTPRKRKHVRSLTFASPPSVKAVTPGDHAMGERSAAQKRKATEDLFSAELRSKKRLNWPASAEKSGCVEKRGPPQKLGRGEKSGFAEKPGYAFADKAGFAFAEKPRIAEKYAFADKANVAEIPGFVEKSGMSKECGFTEKHGRAGNDGVVEVPRSTEAPGIHPNSGMAEVPRLNEERAGVGKLEIVEPPKVNEKPLIIVNTEKVDSIEIPKHTEKPGVKNLVIDETPRFTEKPAVSDKYKLTENPKKTDKAGFSEKSASTDKHGATKKPKLSEKPVDSSTSAESPELTEKPAFSHKIAFSEKHGFCKKTDNDALNQPGFSNSHKPAETSLSSDQSPIEPEYEHKKRRARTKKTPVSKKPPKPKVTLPKLSAKDLFGDSPCKPKNLPPSKRSPDVIAAQSVADQAVPLGQPRESVRNYHITPLVAGGSFQSPFKGIGSSPPQLNEKPESRVVAPESSVALPPVVIHPPPEQVEAPEPEHPILHIQENANTTFNIVPAPLGFPEPTPVKYVYEIGGHKNSNNGFNSPLITPFKKAPPPNLNETQFTLPPTPRMVLEDPDSNSNSMHSLKYSFPLDLWTSTPMKQGVPRTPGRGQSSSSNSHSPILPVRSAVVTQVTNLQLPPSTTVLSIVPVTSGMITQQNTTPPVPSPQKVVTINLSSPDMETSEQKSEGELSSSSEEDLSNAAKSRPTVKNPKSPQKSKPQPDNQAGRRQPPPLLHIPPQQPHASDESRGNHQGLQSQNRPAPAPQPQVNNAAVVVAHSQASQPQNRPEQQLQVRDNATGHSQQPPPLQNGSQQPHATSNTENYSDPPFFKKSRIRQAHQVSVKADGQSQPPTPSITPYQQMQLTHSQPPVLLTRPHQQLQIRDGVVHHPPQPTAPLNRQQQPQVRDSTVAFPQPPVLLARPQQVATTIGSMQYPQAHIHNRIERHLPHMQSHVPQQLVNPYLSRQTPGISFQVSGREKQLTLSEQETLVSLINMSNVKVNTALHSKENPPRLQNQETRPSSQPKAAEVVQKPIDEEEKAHQLMKNVNLNRFIGLLRKKQSLPPPKGN